MDVILNRINALVVDPYILRAATSPLADANWSYPDPSYSMIRQLLVSSVFLFITSMVVYFGFCSLTYWYYFTPINNNIAMWRYDSTQLRNEILTSMWSGFLMSFMTAPFEVAAAYGHAKVYTDVHEYGVAYLGISLILFLVFTDTIIYWVHRALHWPVFYPIHKLHHRYQDTTPFSAFSFHPWDGMLQGIAYHLFVFVLPMHRVLYLIVLVGVGLWTMNIHDRFTFGWFGVNGAAHHTIHHTKFLYNYGQYFTFWDRFYGTHMDPNTLQPYKDTRAYKAKIWGNTTAAAAATQAAATSA